jgi:hypothetical protein
MRLRAHSRHHESPSLLHSTFVKQLPPTEPAGRARGFRGLATGTRAETRRRTKNRPGTHLAIGGCMNINPTIATLFAATLAATSAGCSKDMHAASPLTAEQRSALTSRATPDQVPQMPGMTSFGVRVHIDATPDKVWRTVATDFAKIDQWGGAGVAASTGDEGKLGAVRTCKIAGHMPLIGGSTYEEEIVAFDPQRRYFAYVQRKAAGPTDQVAGETWVDSDGGSGAVVTSIGHISMTFPSSLMMSMSGTRFKRQFLAGMAGLKHFVETGTRVTADNWEAVAQMYPRIFEENQL